MVNSVERNVLKDYVGVNRLPLISHRVIDTHMILYRLYGSGSDSRGCRCHRTAYVGTVASSVRHLCVIQFSEMRWPRVSYTVGHA